jgi:hypothetical protein
MTETTPSSLTCPAGHTFPYDQLTTRDGLYVCPVCDRGSWATSGTRRTWSRGLLAGPLILLLAAIVMFLVENVSGIGIGTTYQNERVGGAGWLTAGSAVSLLGILLLAVGIIRIIVSLRSHSWSRSMISVPLLVLAAGAAILALGDAIELGLNIAFLNTSDPGAGWQLAAQIFDTLFFAGLAGALGWTGLLARHPDPAEQISPSSLPDGTSSVTTKTFT